jgi:beta-glucosidase
MDYNTPDSTQLTGKFASPGDCCSGCGKKGEQWLYFTRTSGGDCWCHKSNHGKVGNKGYTSGQTRDPPPPPPAPHTDTVTTYTGTDPSAAAAVASAADVAIVFVSTTSSEGSDRSSLSFGADQNAMVDAVAKARPAGGTVVVMVNPGAVLTPWAGSVSAAITMFMPGLEMGNALADVLYGDVNPSGRLPLTFPSVENEVNFTKSQWPGLPVPTGLERHYTEKLEVGYRWYDANGVSPKFAFGHGLSYTAFEYSGLSVSSSSLQVTFTVKNAGTAPGAEVAQMYVGYPSSAGEPPQVLRGFLKTGTLAVGSSQTITFTLSSGDLSTWDATQHGWSPVQGTFQVYVGASSRDIRLKGTLMHTNPAKTVQAWV